MASASCVAARAPRISADLSTPQVRVVSELVADGPASARRVRDNADLVLFYGSEHLGSLETCGCPTRPRGSLARLAGYLTPRYRAARPSLLLHAGHWLDDGSYRGQLREDVRVANAWMLQGLDAVGWDALSVTPHDLPYLGQGAPPAALSANVGDVERSRVVTAGELRVGLTAVSGAGDDPVAALSAVLPDLEARSDLVVVLAHGMGRQARDLLGAGHIDVLIEAGEFRSRWEPFLEGDTVWVRSHYQTVRLGELRLWVDEGRITAVRDRQIDLDAAIRSAPRLRTLSRQAREAIDAAQRAVFGETTSIRSSG